MKIEFSKYHALGNDFIILNHAKCRMSMARVRKLVVEICNRRQGVGADGVLLLSKVRGGDVKVDVYNADGSWAEKSGNGLRITAAHLRREKRSRGPFCILMGGHASSVSIRKSIPRGFQVTAELGRPDFLSAHVPVKSRNRYVINGTLKIGGRSLTTTCLAIGNPHTVIFVEDFDFDWQLLGREIEHAAIFPNGTNVEFVKVLSRTKLRVNDWERGAGATCSSGTGAAAAVCAGVMLGKVDRKSEVLFNSGSLLVNWREYDDTIELTGPVQHIATGIFEW